MKKNIIIYFSFFITLLIVAFLTPVEMDGIWGYGFSYNISNGMIPYKDFNMVIGPLYSLVFSIPIILFGNYFCLFEIMHCLIYSLIFTLIYKKIGINTIYIIMTMALSNTMFGYNAFCTILFLLLLLIKDSNFKYKEIIIGVIIGIILMIKHNIGLTLLMVYIYDNRKHLLNSLSILIPIIPIFIYLILNNNFNGYIEFCYLGAESFLKNIHIDFAFLIIYIYMLFTLFKLDNKYKILSLYTFSFQIMCFPILSFSHIIFSLIPILYLLFLYNSDRKKIFYIKYFFIIGFVILILINPIYKSTYYNTNFLINKRLYNEMKKNLEIENKYYNKIKNNYDNIYLFLNYAYAIKMLNNEKNCFYDLVNNGNHAGKENKFLSQIDTKCKNKKCLFILENIWSANTEGYQINTKFLNHIIDSYNYKETLPSGDRVYTNEEVGE